MHTSQILNYFMIFTLKLLNIASFSFPNRSTWHISCQIEHDAQWDVAQWPPSSLNFGMLFTLKKISQGIYSLIEFVYGHFIVEFMLTLSKHIGNRKIQMWVGKWRAEMKHRHAPNAFPTKGAQSLLLNVRMHGEWDKAHWARLLCVLLFDSNKL